MPGSPIRPQRRHGLRYVITLLVVGGISIAGVVGLVVTGKHHGLAMWAAAIVSYVAGLALLVVYRDAFLRVNRRSAPSGAWALAGLVPVIGIGFLPARSSWPTVAFSVFLGILMGTAVINPGLRKRS